MSEVKVGDIVTVTTVHNRQTLNIVVNRYDANVAQTLFGTAEVGTKEGLKFFCATLNWESLDNDDYASVAVFDQPDPNKTFIGGEGSPHGGPDFSNFVNFNYHQSLAAPGKKQYMHGINCVIVKITPHA